MADETPTADGGNTDPTPAPTPDPTGSPQATPPAPQPTPGKTFTQEEVNRIMNDTKKQVRSQFSDYENLKAQAAKLAEIEQAQMSEAEKLQKQLEAAQQAIARAEQARLDALETVKTSTIRAAVVSKAAELNFENPEDAYSLLDKSGLSLNDAGEVEGLEPALKTLAETKKYLIKQSRTTLEPFNPAGAGSGMQETAAQRRARIYGSGGNMFDPSAAEERGGGVVWPKGIPTDT